MPYCPHTNPAPPWVWVYERVTGCPHTTHPTGDCEHYTLTPPPPNIDRPVDFIENKFVPMLLEKEGETDLVNCYPGKPGLSCLPKCYIFVDMVGGRWKAWGHLENQLRSCGHTTREIYIIGDWDTLGEYQMRASNIKAFLKGAALSLPNLKVVEAREPSQFGKRRIRLL